MSEPFESDDAIWRRCELAWEQWLIDRGYFVTRLNEATGNTRGTRAPLVAGGGKEYRAPDFLAVLNTSAEYWEVKFRSSVSIDPLTGVGEFWIELGAFRDYLAIAETGQHVQIALYEMASSTASGRWLCIDVKRAATCGRQDVRYGRDATPLDAWVWPAAEMVLVDGPEVAVSSSEPPVFVAEGAGRPVDVGDLVLAEQRIRQGHADGSYVDALLANRRASLDVLRRALRLEAVPQYSVTRIGLTGIDLEAVWALLSYGIRLFLIADRPLSEFRDDDEIAALREARLLEFACVESVPSAAEGWIIDGVMPQSSGAMVDVLEAADLPGGINVGQFKIVHEDARSNVLVSAGAGTGKTETMAERILFLLATSRLTAPTFSRAELRLDQFVLLTFTNEAARQMRERLARALVVRLRLSPLCVLPVTAWLMQLAGTRIQTIHAFAQGELRHTGASIGVTPAVRVSSSIMELREIIIEELSGPVARLTARYGVDVPAAYEWRRHIESVWESLENNGLSPVRFGESTTSISWGVAQGGSAASLAVASTIPTVVDRVAERFAELQRDRETLSPGHLVPAALAAVGDESIPSDFFPAYMFVDEFQDTDVLQMRFLLTYSARANTRLFVVGDPKQAIYRFRGAQSNAFDELRTVATEFGISEFAVFPLSKNFRSDESILEDFDQGFGRWGSRGLLPYGSGDALLPGEAPKEGVRGRVRVKVLRRTADRDDAIVAQVRAWLDSSSGQSIALLCRTNAQAVAAKDVLRENGIQCDVRLGGDFFRSPAVLDLRIFLQAILDPRNNAVVLELLESPWAAGISRSDPPQGVAADDWPSIGRLAAWRERAEALLVSGRVPVEDLEAISVRLEAIARLARLMPAIAWLVECFRALDPVAIAGSHDDDEQRRYARCVSHLVTILSERLSDGPVTLHRIAKWVELQIATNRTEDEPGPEDELSPGVVALTVHRAKGREFHRVLIPTTWSPYGPSQSSSTVSVVATSEATHEVIYDWSYRGGRLRTGSAAARLRERNETEQEEARLLYVAMTRAMHELVLFRLSSPRPSTWGELIEGFGATS